MIIAFILGFLFGLLVPVYRQLIDLLIAKIAGVAPPRHAGGQGKR